MQIAERWWRRGLVCWYCTVGLLCSPAAWAAAAMQDTAGRIDAIEQGAQTIVISGRRYVAALGIQVQINGSYGAFSMLQPGMRVQIRFTHTDTGTRELHEVTELTGVAVLEES